MVPGDERLEPADDPPDEAAGEPSRPPREVEASPPEAGEAPAAPSGASLSGPPAGSPCGSTQAGSSPPGSSQSGSSQSGVVAGRGPLTLPRIDGYRVEGYLGRGSTGVVYSAVQLAVDRPVALKVLHPELIGSKRAVRRLQREARTAARLAHPGIISAIDMGESEGRWWYAMELVEGISLAERVAERGPLTEREVLRMFIPLCAALQHAHEGGVVHRDIKPGNVLIDTSGRARLVDLGLAFAEDDPMLTKPGGTLGTPHFISPEQAKDPSRADVRSDIWSLGATMFQAVTGHPPFEGESVAEILSGVLHERIPDPRQLRAGISKGMALVLRKCLTREPSRRYQEPAALMRDLERILERRSPEVRASSLDPVRDERPPWRRPLPVGAAALAIAAAGALGLARPWSEAAPEEPGRWAALEELRDRFLAGELPHARALRSLAALGPVPDDVDADPDAFRADVEADLGSAVAAVTAGLGLAFEERLLAQDFAAARSLLTLELSRELQRRTGFEGPAAVPVPALERELETWKTERIEELSRVRAAVVDDARRAFRAYYMSDVRRVVANHLAASRWRSARELLEGDRDAWLAASGANVRGLESIQRAEVRSAVDADVFEDQRRLETSWQRAEGQLRAFVEREEERLRDRLEQHESGVASELLDAWRTELARLGIVAAEIPEDWEWGSRKALDAARLRLARLEDERVLEAAQAGFERTANTAESLCRRRQYTDARLTWETDLAQPWRDVVRARMLLRQRECRLLEDLLLRAARGVEERHGEPFAPRLGGIPHEGTLRAGPDPLRRGFDLERRGSGLVEHLYLREPMVDDLSGVVLGASDVERLAGLDENDPSDRLVQAIFRYHEGDFEGARVALPVGRIDEDEALLADLRERIEGVLMRRERTARERRQRLDALLLNVRKMDEVGNTPTKILAEIEHVQREFGDLLREPDRRLLDGVRAGLDVPEATLQDVFAPDELTRTPPLDVRLTWTFEGEAGAWIVGEPWRVSAGELWLSAEQRDDTTYLDPSRAARLLLRPPLNVERQLRLVLELEVGDEVHDNAVAVELGGYTVLLHDDPRDARAFFCGEGEELEELLARSRDPRTRKKGIPFKGLEPGRRHVLEVLVWRQQRRLEVSLDGERLDRPQGLRPAADPHLVLRSQLPLRVRRVVLEGQRMPEPR